VNRILNRISIPRITGNVPVDFPDEAHADANIALTHTDTVPRSIRMESCGERYLKSSGMSSSL